MVSASIAAVLGANAGVAWALWKEAGLSTRMTKGERKTPQGPPLTDPSIVYLELLVMLYAEPFYLCPLPILCWKPTAALRKSAVLWMR